MDGFDLAPSSLPTWLAHYAPLLAELDQASADVQALASGAQFLDHERFRGACNAWLESQRRRERMVVPIARKTSAAEYERRIVDRGEIETRSNLHDAMNALVWLQWPASKAAISVLHVAEISRAKDHSRRGAKRDAATLFDEHGVVLLVDDPSIAARLRAHDWVGVWCERRDEFLASARVITFGHALLARLFAPHKSLVAHALVMTCKQAWPEHEQIDVQVARRIAQLERPADLLAMPVMGLPGWSAGQDEAFYADPKIFRPAQK